MIIIQIFVFIERYLSFQMASGNVNPVEQVGQFKEFLQLFNKISEQCFADCVNDFTSRKVSNEESTCSISCLTKYLQSTQRISRRFQDEYLKQNDGAKKGSLGF